MTRLDEMRKEDSKRREIELSHLRAELQVHQQNVAATYVEQALNQTARKGCSAPDDPDRYPDRAELIRRIDCQERTIQGLAMKIEELEKKFDHKVT